jgi:hypothetical protein
MRRWTAITKAKLHSTNWWMRGLTKGARMERHSRATIERQAGRIATLMALDRAVPTFPLKVTMTRVSARKFNEDNLARAFKHLRDGIADALKTTDEDPRVTWDPKQEKGKPYEVRIVIEEVQ